MSPEEGRVTLLLSETAMFAVNMALLAASLVLSVLSRKELC